MEHPPTSDSPALPPAVVLAKFRVKFHDGPAAGIVMEYDKEQPTYRYGAWTYEATGKRDGDYWLYVRQHRSALGRRVIAMLKRSSGSDPRLLPRPEPTRVVHRGRNAPCWCGSGKKYKRCHASPQSN